MTSNNPRRLLTAATASAADAAAASAFRPDAGQLIGHAIAAVIRQEMPGALAQAIWQVHPPRMCAYCLEAFNDWETDHADLVQAAVAAAQAGGQPGQPLDFRPHLPAELQPLVPDVERAITTVSGTEVCKAHASEALAG